MLLGRLEQSFGNLKLPKGVLKQEFYIIQVTSSFGMNKFGHIEAMKVIFSTKCSNFYVDFENAIKLRDNVDRFEDNCV